jgi:hypothetical protein
LGHAPLENFENLDPMYIIHVVVYGL